jgi:UDP-N-acetylglucosamine--N-acetylmuramyl-(pentapeptide) pyrophosphoryl-undecaprenol N-acetylglucosamine transferase
MAWLRGKPVLIHEQNAVLGLSNRLLSPFATRILTAFAEACASAKSLVLGNPIAEELLTLPPPQQRYAKRTGPLRILILGGSQGAQQINAMMPQVLASNAQQDLEIWHQSGVRGAAEVIAAYGKQGIDARVSPFIRDMAKAYGWADLVICRAGALTLAEIAGVGVAAVILPLTGVAGNHQVRNAQHASNAGGALQMSMQDIQSGRLNAFLENARDRKVLLKMACAFYQLRVADATGRVVAECRQAFHV